MPQRPSPLQRETKPEPAGPNPKQTQKDPKGVSAPAHGPRRPSTDDEDDKPLAVKKQEIAQRKAAAQREEADRRLAESQRNFPAHFPKPGSRRSYPDAASERAAAALAGARTDEFLRTLELRVAADKLDVTTRRMEKANKRDRNVFFSHLPGYKSEKKFLRSREEYRSAQNDVANAEHELRKAKDAVSRLERGAVGGANRGPAAGGSASAG